jgi:putative peptidoglycan lipid II flippase
MVKRIIGFFGKEIEGLHEAAYVLAFFTFLSQLLAVVRDRLLAGTFGASEIVDIYYASFRLPDLLFVLMTSFISASVLVPFLAQNISDKKYSQKILNSLFSFFMISVIVVAGIIFIFTPEILQITAPGIANNSGSPESFATLVLFTRLLLLSPILLGISQLFGSIVQAYRKFFVYAISPVLYNLGIILGIVFFYPNIGDLGLIYGVLVGILMHVFIQLPTVARHKMVPKLTLNLDWSSVREIILVSLPRTVTLASTQIVLLVLVAVASVLTVGSIAIFNFSYNLQSVPLAIIGVSYSLAAFPTLSRLFADGKTDEFLAQLITAARHIIFWSLPVIVMFVVLRAQIVRVILGSGQFDWTDTRLTAAALAIFAVSVLAQNLILLFVRGYYSAGQTKKPLFINLISMAATISFIFIFKTWFEMSEGFRLFIESLLRVNDLTGTIVLMLPLAFSVGMILNAVLLWIIFEKDFRGFSKTLWRTLVQSLTASLFAGYVAYVFLQLFDKNRLFDLDTLFGIFMQGFVSGTIGLLGAVLFLIVLRNTEIREVINAMKHKIWKFRPETVDQEDVLGRQ